MDDDNPALGGPPRRGKTALRNRPLNPKQRRFVEEYLVDLNATQAARRAGYKPGAARDTGPRLLHLPAVAEAVESALAERAERTKVTADRVVVELAKVAFGDPRRLLALGPQGVELRTPAELTEAEAALVSEITETRTGKERSTRRVKLHCKMTALTALGKHLGLFNGRLKPPEPREDAGADERDDPRERLARKIARISARLRAEEAASGADEG